MDVILGPLIGVLLLALGILRWAVIIYIIMGWLITFNVLNTRNQFVYAVMNGLARVIEPLLRPFRRIIPQGGGIDFSPILLFLAIFFLEQLLQRVAIRFLGGF